LHHAARMRSTVLCFLVIGCTSSTHPTAPDLTDLQMNDLSVLLPLPRSQAELDAQLVPTSPAVGGQLLPQSIYYMTSLPVEYASLHAVAFSLDPCFGALGTMIDDASCHNQLRIVFQPITFDASSSQAFVEDAAVHAFYEISRDDLLAALDEVVAARKAAGGDHDLGPLAPHPLVVSEGLDGPLAQAFAKTITKYAGQAKLVRMTALAVAAVNAASVALGPGVPWQLEQFQVDNETPAPKDIPTLSRAENIMALDAATDPLEAQGTPDTTSADNLSMLASFMKASQASASDRQHAFGAALRVLNPHDNSPDTIDCASCHLAQPAVELVGKQLGMTDAGNPDAFVPDPSIPMADLAETTSLVGTGGVLNIHAFSYRIQEPAINRRVINETAANLAYLQHAH
jgi:hypothetical protein